ncbi:hypothetical protein RHMOL_Rhmol06G0133900 [Rhododendron molle]|uniref:Uncharacterized protein n=1 Tax=Rhododendron molle TaxID=49168 RepID=A0ACC0NDX9_RHOML|nr:hypothetical protein RHMOL_Rhmol06G0133900 [Rhododendron molle]
MNPSLSYLSSSNNVDTIGSIQETGERVEGKATVLELLCQVTGLFALGARCVSGDEPPVHLQTQTVLSSPNPSAGLAHPIIVISSDSESSGDGFAELFIREYLERRRSRRQTSSIASNMSNSSDSNVERDHEYDCGFDTEPEITFTPNHDFRCRA